MGSLISAAHLPHFLCLTPLYLELDGRRLVGCAVREEIRLLLLEEEEALPLMLLSWQEVSQLTWFLVMTVGGGGGGKYGRLISLTKRFPMPDNGCFFLLRWVEDDSSSDESSVASGSLKITRIFRVVGFENMVEILLVLGGFW